MPCTAPAYVRLSQQLTAAVAGRYELYVNAAVKLMTNRRSQLISSGLRSAQHTSARIGQIMLNVIVVVIIIAVLIITTPLAAGTA